MRHRTLEKVVKLFEGDVTLCDTQDGELDKTTHTHVALSSSLYCKLFILDNAIATGLHSYILKVSADHWNLLDLSNSKEEARYLMKFLWHAILLAGWLAPHLT